MITINWFFFSQKRVGYVEYRKELLKYWRWRSPQPKVQGAWRKEGFHVTVSRNLVDSSISTLEYYEGKKKEREREKKIKNLLKMYYLDRFDAFIPFKRVFVLLVFNIQRNFIENWMEKLKHRFCQVGYMQNWCWVDKIPLRR